MRLIYLLVTQSGLTLCDPTDCIPPGPSVHGTLQARILEWVAIPFSRGCSRPRDQNWGLLLCRQILYCLSYRRWYKALWENERGICYKRPHIARWLLKVTLKRRGFLVLSCGLLLLWVLSVIRVLFSCWLIDNLIHVCAHLLQEQRPPAMSFYISLNSGCIVSSHPCSLLFPSPPSPCPRFSHPCVQAVVTHICLICCNSCLQQWGR